MALVLLACLLLFAVGSGSKCSTIIDEHYPQQYVAQFAREPLALDGRLDEPFWTQVPWTNDFVDITTSTVPEYRTRAKLRWNSSHLFVGAEVFDPNIWANITHVCHCFDPKEDQVIFHGNDFEVFVDAAGSCQYYKETEINAANQYWDLCINKPYENGGYENSSRVFGKRGFDMFPQLQTAVNIDGCTLNVPGACTKWTVEMAFPLADLMYNNTSSPPQNGTMWRLNFSRVEWHVLVENGRYIKHPSCQSCPDPGSGVEDNWVWSRMDAIDIHHPELWGFLQFSTDNATAAMYNEYWPALYAAHILYYAQVAHEKTTGRYGATVSDVVLYAKYPSILEGCDQVEVVMLNLTPQGWTAVIRASLFGKVISIDQNRFIQYK